MRMDEVSDDFESAYRDLFPRAAMVAYRLLGDKTAAEDVAAEALARAYARWGRIAGLAHRDGWVLRVATNLRQCQVVALRYLSGMGEQEVAHALGVNSGDVLVCSGVDGDADQLDRVVVQEGSERSKGSDEETRREKHAHARQPSKASGKLSKSMANRSTTTGSSITMKSCADGSPPAPRSARSCESS